MFGADVSTLFFLGIPMVFVFMTVWAIWLKKHYSRGLEQNGVETIAIIDKYEKWDLDMCCFFHFERLADGKTVYGRTIVRDLDTMQREYPPNTKIRIIYQVDKSKNWRIVTNEEGYYVKV